MRKEFGSRLHHTVPGWVPSGANFHIRIRCAPDNPTLLTEPKLAVAVLDSFKFYHNLQRWNLRACLLMPDHLHALLAFPPEARMSGVIRNWKRFHTRQNNVCWQEGFFDHRIRNEEEQTEKFHYILNNPVVKKFCKRPEDWPWVLTDRDLT